MSWYYHAKSVKFITKFLLKLPLLPQSSGNGTKTLIWAYSAKGKEKLSASYFRCQPQKCRTISMIIIFIFYLIYYPNYRRLLGTPNPSGCTLVHTSGYTKSNTGLICTEWCWQPGTLSPPHISSKNINSARAKIMNTVVSGYSTRATVPVSLE